MDRLTGQNNGFELGETGKKSDIDECKGNHSCHVNAACMNTLGSHVCQCHAGYTGNGENCTDIDECQKNTHDCHLNATCQNTNGSFMCTCLFGFNGDGRNCTDIDECARNLSCHVNANCTNTIGSHVCICHTGYTGDGQTCSDIDECSQMNICDKNASCSNTQGSYSCACNPKYIGDGLTCKADPCYNYINLSDADRKSTYNTPYGGEKCDDDSSSIIFGKWYRFVGDAGTKMPTQCVPGSRCGADFSGWLKDDHPTLADGEVFSVVCFTRGADCCKKLISIKVKDCGSYFIYKLPKVPGCNLRYCSTD